MKSFSQFLGEAYGVVGGTRFERRTPTSAELKAAQVARDITKGTTRQKEMAAVRAGVNASRLSTPTPTPAAPQTPVASTPAPRKPYDVRSRDINARGSFDPRFDTSEPTRNISTSAAQQRTQPSQSEPPAGPKPGSPEDEEDIRKYYNSLPGPKKYGTNPSKNPKFLNKMKRLLGPNWLKRWPGGPVGEKNYF